MKDHFSTSPEQYAKYRPDYPQTIFDFIYPLLNEKSVAWDCGTGNGQIARELSKDFKLVEATDISKQQLEHAFIAENINYSAQPAEKTNFTDNTFDLITVAQAVHWFDFDKFNTEVKRVGKPNSIIALIGYELFNITPEIDAVINHFYKNIIGPFWLPERKHIQERYQKIPFPFRELETPEINNIKLWKYEHLIGYLNTWSAVKHFKEKNKYNPIDDIENDLKNAWGSSEIRRVIFPIIFRVGRVK
ncbi:class I SAM-dependent methyltransferase [Sphingobacterium bovistauri]|uniref:Class I SAM-dependent methyltransferase n=1 Tax=Sphingobacterium bovistauri TaxID=2781959 RepID=A0ABS7Z3U9_9SPHI|nr:class I SAM-dependent methyltransferase [Sphingobacterium bovistauri]MCA5004805.1 class I SAM-dependent methyltransferase [Sphingobacterium bovistauri]